MPDIFVSDGGSAIAPTEEAKQETIVTPSTVNVGGKELSIITSFCKNPINVSFSDQDPGEVILLFLRRHIITNLLWIIKGALLALVPLFVFIILVLANSQTSFLPSNYLVFVLVFYYFIVIEYLFLNYLNWFYNISLVTSVRVYDVNFGILVFKDVAGTKIAQIEDVSNTQVGPVRSIFDYGDVEVQTAATEEKFDFLAIPHPEQVVHIIDDLIGGENAV